MNIPILLLVLVASTIVDISYSRNINVPQIYEESDLYEPLLPLPPSHVRRTRREVNSNLTLNNEGGAHGYIDISQTLLNKNGNLDPNWKMEPTELDGGLNYQLPIGGASVGVKHAVDLNHATAMGTEVNAQGNLNLLKSDDGRPNLNITSIYDQRFGGPKDDVGAHGAIDVSQTLLNKNGHKLDSQMQVSQNWDKSMKLEPTELGGGLNYEGPIGGASVGVKHAVDLNHATAMGTEVNTQGNLNLLKSDDGRPNLNITGTYDQRFGGPNDDGSTRGSVSVSQTLLNKNGHKIDGHVKVSQDFNPIGPTNIGGGLNYQGPIGGASVGVKHAVDLNHATAMGTEVNAQGNLNLLKSDDGRPNLNITGTYDQRFGVPNDDGSTRGSVSVSQTVLNKNGHKIDGHVKVSQDFNPKWNPIGPTNIGGVLNYQGPIGGASIGVNHAGHMGTTINALGNLHLVRSRDGRTNFNLGGNYNQRFGGPAGYGHPNFGARLSFRHRF